MADPAAIILSAIENRTRSRLFGAQSLAEGVRGAGKSIAAAIPKIREGMEQRDSDSEIAVFDDFLQTLVAPNPSGAKSLEPQTVVELLTERASAMQSKRGREHAMEALGLYVQGEKFASDQRKEKVETEMAGYQLAAAREAATPEMRKLGRRKIEADIERSEAGATRDIAGAYKDMGEAQLQGLEREYKIHRNAREKAQAEGASFELTEKMAGAEAEKAAAWLAGQASSDVAQWTQVLPPAEKAEALLTQFQRGNPNVDEDVLLRIRKPLVKSLTDMANEERDRGEAVRKAQEFDLKKLAQMDQAALGQALAFAMEPDESIKTPEDRWQKFTAGASQRLSPQGMAQVMQHLGPLASAMGSDRVLQQLQLQTQVQSGQIQNLTNMVGLFQDILPIGADPNDPEAMRKVQDAMRRFQQLQDGLNGGRSKTSKGLGE